MDIDTRPLAERYWEILQEYLEDNSESSLNRAYELSRQALVEGYGVLEMGAIHHEALRRLLEEYRVPPALLKAAGNFLCESLSPFEMSHRGASDGTRALRHVNEVLEAELKRIAHAIHDEAGQLLATVHIAIADIVADLPPQTRARFVEVDHLLRKMEVELRNLSHELRPTVLDNLGLVPALEFLAEKVSRRTGLAISVEGETKRRLPAAVETALYRIVQEALNNAAKHSHANSVKIELQCTALQVACRVRDDGRGFDSVSEPAPQGLGLIGIRERLNALGGSLRVIAEPERGTTLQADIPLRG